MNDTLLSALTLGSIGLTAYHHVGYPALLRLARRQSMPPVVTDSASCPTVAIVMPAHDEADHIVQKIRNLAALDYPAHRLRILVACDGCGDDTVALCHATLAEPGCSHLDATVIDFPENRGKVTVVNDAVAMAAAEILVMTDVSAMLPAEALRRAVAHFGDPRVGAAGGTYRIRNSSSEGEAAYWSVQLGVKRRAVQRSILTGESGKRLSPKCNTL
jgi:cellulose synthase/poly-beta-1,6-N-acetylglucosamine synthase-like glycosyltransferase